MRRSPLLLLLLATVASAGDDFAARLKALDDARAFTLEPGGQARVYPAVEALAATNDVRAVEPIAAYLLETILDERQLTESIRKQQKEVADAAERADALDHELKQLDLKEKAGDRTLGPTIEQRTAERLAAQRKGDDLMKGIQQMDRTIGFLRELRDRLADDCSNLLKGRKGEEAATAISGVRRALDVADKDQALYLVRILAATDLAEVEEQLLEILAAPKADPAVRLRAQYALAPRLTHRGADALLRLWERDPNRFGAHVQHVLSLAAKKRLATIEDARVWVATLP